MGWTYEEASGGDHEGYVVGLVEDENYPETFSVRLRELDSPRDDYDLADVRIFQVGCECGWRSRRFLAPANTEWRPFMLVLHDHETEEEARQLWRRHWESERSAGYARLIEVRHIKRS